MIFLLLYFIVTLTESEFILGNVRVEGYYRVNYDRDSWDRIAARLDSQFYTVSSNSFSQGKTSKNRPGGRCCEIYYVVCILGYLKCIQPKRDCNYSTIFSW